MKALAIRQLSKIYDNGLKALDNISLDVEMGDFFGLLGANGAGKSTTIGIITSLITKSTGDVEVYGHSLDKEPNAVKACIGLVPQEFNCNIFEPCYQILINQAGYYGIPRRIAKERAEYYLNKLNLWDKRDQASKELSGGMKRRLMIARALIHQPKMLILDEPTAGVDIEVRHDMWAFLKALNDNGTTIILTTHYLEEAEQLCRHIGIIDKGKIIENTETQTLLNKCALHTLVLDLVKPIHELPSFKLFDAIKQNDMQIEITFENTLPLNKIFNELDQNGLEVSHAKNKTNRLENLFLNIIREQE